MKTENTPNELTAASIAQLAIEHRFGSFGNKMLCSELFNLMLDKINQYASIKLQEANKKEILGDRKIVELEHDKTVLKAELKAKDAMLEKMSESIQALIDNYELGFGVRIEKINELLTQYKQGKLEMKKEQIDIFYDFEKWLKKFKKSENDCFWYNNKTLFCREAMFEIYLEQI